ncbi:MAG: preprotein translocase subunit SecE [Proteobacteria bacterium]|nr:preprotein translocase subunit SecE [Pseudomonadota bacterium]
MAKTEVATGNAFTRGIGFFRESWLEFKKVHRPTRQETIDLTIRVFLLIFIFAIFLGLADAFVSWGMKQILI